MTEGGMALSTPRGCNWVGEFTQDQRCRCSTACTRCGRTRASRSRASVSHPTSWNMSHHVERQLAAIKERCHRSPISTCTFTTAAAWRSFHLRRAPRAGRGDTLASRRASAASSVALLRQRTAAQMAATEDLNAHARGHGITPRGLYKLVEVVWLAEKSSAIRCTVTFPRRAPARFDHLYSMDMPHTKRSSRQNTSCSGEGLRSAPSPWKEPITSYQRPDACKK